VYVTETGKKLIACLITSRSKMESCDLSVDEEIRSLFERVRQESGHLNILVNNCRLSERENGRQALLGGSG
jgi:NAD(P)-dependent dehydrogenase (short-subunit alcohol dehydrogenase family)